MPKPRTKRKAIREERKTKRQERVTADHEVEARKEKKRRVKEEQELGEAEFAQPNVDDEQYFPGAPPAPREFFGMLTDEEQERFRQADEMFEINEFETNEQRENYLENVYIDAQGKELKLACSQSCSRLLEKMILLAGTRQKKKLFEAFAGHFPNLIQHRFASHCCETLFLQSAPVVTQELGGIQDDAPHPESEADDKPLPSMEELFLLTLDELEGQMGFLLTDKFASHALRVILLILSGRPLEQTQSKSLAHSKKKEFISLDWLSKTDDELHTQIRAVPESFTLATKKIIADSTAGMDATALKVLTTHPTGNPVLQLLLELDLDLNSENKEDQSTLADRLLPGAPASLKDSSSPASDFINSMLYEPIGSRLLETLITHCPGKLFKALYRHVFAERIQTHVRNDIACYPAIRVLNRLSKEDLVASVEKILPQMPKLVELSRLNVIKTLFERCQARGVTAEADQLTRALVETYGSDPKVLVSKLCLLDKKDSDTKDKMPQQFAKKESALISHGSQLITTMLSIPGEPSSAIQQSLVSLPPDHILHLATSSAATAKILLTAFTTPSSSRIFHKSVVAPLIPHTLELAESHSGHNVLNAIISIPSKGDKISIPFHFKQNIVDQLANMERDHSKQWKGQTVLHVWKVELWQHKRNEWVNWAREVDPSPKDGALLPWQIAMAREKENGRAKGSERTGGFEKRKRELEATA